MQLLIIWLLIFIIAVCALIQSSDWLALSGQRILNLFTTRRNNFNFATALLAVTLPEIGIALAATLLGNPEVAIAVIIGSSIANILLVTGLAAFSSGPILLKKEYAQIDLPLFAASIALFYLAASDGKINSFEGVLMILMFFIYAAYSSRPRHSLTNQDLITPEILTTISSRRITQILPTRLEKQFAKITNANQSSSQNLGILIFIGAGLLFVFASYLTVASLVGISDWLQISTSLTALIILSIGTALPEILSGGTTIRHTKNELTLGNLFAATSANLLLVSGIASLVFPLILEGAILSVGLPFLLVSALLLIVAVISGKLVLGKD